MLYEFLTTLGNLLRYLNFQQVECTEQADWENGEKKKKEANIENVK